MSDILLYTLFLPVIGSSWVHHLISEAVCKDTGRLDRFTCTDTPQGLFPDMFWGVVLSFSSLSTALLVAGLQNLSWTTPLLVVLAWYVIGSSGVVATGQRPGIQRSSNETKRPRGS